MASVDYAEKYENWSDSETPPPGSDEALDEGCTCPRIDNGKGHGGAHPMAGTTGYVYTTTCPVHGGDSDA